MNGWIDEVFLEVGDTERDWRCCMDDVIKSVLLLFEYFVKSVRNANVLDKGKSDFAFPCRVKIQDFLGFIFRSHTGSCLIP